MRQSSRHLGSSRDRPYVCRLSIEGHKLRAHSGVLGKLELVTGMPVYIQPAIKYIRIYSASAVRCALHIVCTLVEPESTTEAL